MHYKPSYLVKASIQHETMALVGAPGSGKSYSTLTFPNRTYGDLDHKAPKGEDAVELWSAQFMDKNMVVSRHAPSDPANYRDGIKKFLRQELPKFLPDQTYIHDSWTQHIVMAMQQIRIEEIMQGTRNKFYVYQELKKYCEVCADFIKSAPCRVVTTFHETPEWDDGAPTGKIKVVQDGQFRDQLFAIYTDVYRCLNGIYVRKPDAGGKITTSRIEGRYWQVQGDSTFDANANGTLAPLLRKHGIKYVETWFDPASGNIQGGYNEIQRIYNEDKLIVKEGILQRPTL